MEDNPPHMGFGFGEAQAGPYPFPGGPFSGNPVPPQRVEFTAEQERALADAVHQAEVEDFGSP